MGTKNNPGEYDCAGKAFDDEPTFTLRAKDPMAAELVRNWVQNRRYHFFCHIVPLSGAAAEREKAKLAEALNLAEAMDQWRAANPDKRKD